MTAPKSHKQKTYDQGKWAETVAALWLCLKGYKILEQRYKTPMGEIDLIARRRTTLAIIEVKAHETHEKGLYAVRPQARRRIENAARHFLMKHPAYADFTIRFDVMTVCGAISVHHLDNAWIEGQ